MAVNLGHSAGVPADVKFPEAEAYLVADYDQDEDSLFLRISEGLEVGVSVDPDVWIHMDPSTKEVRAITVERFLSHFRHRSPEIEVAFEGAVNQLMQGKMSPKVMGGILAGIRQ